MDSLSLRLPRSAVLTQDKSDIAPGVQTEPRTQPAIRADTVFVASFGNAVAADYAAFIGADGRNSAVVVGDKGIRQLVVAPVRSLPIDEFLHATEEYPSAPGPVTKRACSRAGAGADQPLQTDVALESPTYVNPDSAIRPSLIIFTNSRLTARERCDLDDILEAARRCHTTFVGIVSTFRVHLDDPRVVEVENYIVSRASDLDACLVVFRPGHVLGKHSSMRRMLERFAPLYPLFPESLSSCFIEESELFSAIETERLLEERRPDPLDAGEDVEKMSRPNRAGRSISGKNRAYTLLGSNRPWRDMLYRFRTPGHGALFATAVSTLLSWLLVGRAIALVLTLLAWRFPWLRQWNVQTLKPRSIRELLSLCHRGNFDHVKVVGYNNGVHHFGHRHPAKTVVSTIRCRRMAHAGTSTLKADCGTTVRRALDFLAKNNQELYVVPNYSYVSLGTSFFVPIHGSAVDFSTVADTICRVVLYDPDTDRIISAARDDAAFREHVYNMQARVVVLRLYLLTRPKSSYFIHRETLENLSSSDLLLALRDPSATNVEIRQAQAASAKVTVARYYTDLGEISLPALELPRDALGRLWDRLEENSVTSYLMHAVGRHVVWHTELFLTPGEFDVFWRTHDRLPLRKIQLRYLRRDGLPHSPCRDVDCISADLFVFRRDRFRFLEYLETTLPTVRTNPGKHSH